VEILHGIEALPAEGDTVVTIGMFDGVHRGHQAVLRRTRSVGIERGLRPVAVTFEPHPREVLTPGSVPGLLTTLEQKARLLEGLRIEQLLVLRFDEELASWPPDEFVDRVLVDGLHAGHVTVGSNFTFGHKAAGDLQMLSELGEARDISVEGVALLHEDGHRISSTSVREALARGDLDWPLKALGRRYAIEGTVVRGAGRGDDLGFPTANLETHPRAQLPQRGVYAGRGLLGWKAWPAAINVGMNPTFGEEPLHVEAFLLDFDGDIRGETLQVELWERLRDEERFESPDALSAQIARDVDRTRELVA